ncbi:MAG: hypothetical protein MJ072_03690, partial [Clostridia bacterium]|nr:hypothetical protein [Clostridia bacterium]
LCLTICINLIAVSVLGSCGRDGEDSDCLGSSSEYFESFEQTNNRATDESYGESVSLSKTESNKDDSSDGESKSDSEKDGGPASVGESDGTDKETGESVKTYNYDVLTKWQSMISDDALIKNVVIPGSHDSGTSGMIAWAETQNSSVKSQLDMGIRYFDLRIAIGSSNQAVIYHGPIKGQGAKSIIYDFYDFLEDKPTEFLILDFQHFDDDEANETACKWINDMIPMEKRVNNDTGKPDVDYIDGLTVSACRGKCLILWGRDDEYLKEGFIFKRNNDGCTKENCCLHSYYDENLHKSSSEELIGGLKNYVEDYVDRFDAKGMFVLQCQLTGVGLIAPKARENGHDKNMSEYIETLYSEPFFKYVNIIMRDYVTENKCMKIVELNEYKSGVMKNGVNFNF